MKGRAHGVPVICAILAVACADAPPPAPPGLEASVARGVDHLESAALREPHALAMGYLLHRRFGLDAFEDAPARYDAILASVREPASHKDRTMPNLGALRLFRRLVRDDNPFSAADLADAEGSLDLTTIAALYCDREPLPAGYGSLIRAEASTGGYQLTHAVLALAWFDDNGCEPPVGASERERWLRGLDAIVRAHPLHDMGFEAAALLAYLGRRDLIPEGWAARVIAAQEPDGGWRPCPAPPCDPPTGLRPERAASHWHSTALALWALLETTTTAPPHDRFVPGARPVTSDSRASAASRSAWG